MKVQQVSFKNNSITPEQRTSSEQSTVITTSSDKFEASSKKDNTGKYILAGLGVVTLIVAIVKHKQIGEFLNKLFKGKKTVGDVDHPKQTPQSKPTIKDGPSIVPTKPKLELPKPKFKYDETNPVEFAKEKAKYIDSIIGSACLDEQKALAIMGQFDKYGSKDQLLDLLAGISNLKPEHKTEKVGNKFVRLYDKFTKGEPVEEVLTSPLSAIIEEYGQVLSKDSILLILKGFKKAGEHPGDLLDVRGFIKGDRHYHSFLSKFSQEDINKIDKFAQDAEEIVRKRAYKDSK